MTADLRKKLETSAHKIKRSLNAEIIARLEESYQRELEFWINTGQTPRDTDIGKKLSRLPHATQIAIRELEIAKARIELSIQEILSNTAPK